MHFGAVTILNMRNWIVIGSAIAIMLLGLYGSAVIVLDEERLKSLVARHVENYTGRRIEIRGDLKVSLFPGLRLTAERVQLAGPDNYAGPALFEAQYLEMRVRLLSLIRGEMEASQVSLTGASINLHTDENGQSSLDGLLAAAEAGSAAQDWLSGPVSLDDVLVNLTDSMGERQDSFSVEQIELDGFAAGRPLDFRFRGNVGDPELFDWLEVDGLLVPLSNGNFRLSNMRMLGELEQGHFELEMLGNLSFTPGPPLAVALDEGRLRINQHQFQAAVDYTGFDRPYVNARLSAESIDLDVASIPRLLLTQVGPGGDSSVIRALGGLDFDLAVDVQQVAQLGLVLKDLVLAAQARDGLINVDSATAEIPGGYFSGIGRFDLRASGGAAELGLRIDASDFQQLASSIPLTELPGGSGALSMALTVDASDGAMNWNGQGGMELWDGRWTVLPRLIPGVSADPTAEFDFFSAGIGISPGHLTLSEVQLVSSELVIQGDLDFSLPPGELNGELALSNEDQLVLIGVSGALSGPDLRWTLPESEPGQ